MSSPSQDHKFSLAFYSVFLIIFLIGVFFRVSKNTYIFNILSQLLLVAIFCVARMEARQILSFVFFSSF